MAVTPLSVRDGLVPFQSITIIMQPGEIREIPGTLRFIQLINATDATKLFISFNGASFYNLPTGEQLEDFEADAVWVQNTDVSANTVTIVTGMASLKANRVVISSASTLSVQTVGTTAVSTVDGGVVSLGAKADAAATTDAGTFSLIALIKRLLGKFDALVSSVFTLDSAGTTNATSITSAATRVKSIDIMNASGAAKFVRLYDKASAPTVGTDVSKRTFAIPAASSLHIAYPNNGDTYALGLGLAITGAAAYNDATAVAAHDVQLAINYL